MATPVQECNSRPAGPAICIAAPFPARPYRGRLRPPLPHLSSMPSSSEKPSKPPSLWRLGGLHPWDLLKSIVREIGHEDLFGAASNLAFNWLLALFPMLIFLFAIFGIFASRFTELEDSLFSFTAGLLPYDAYRLLAQVADEVTTHTSRTKAAFGIAAALWFASGGMSALISTLNVAARVRETRSWLRVRAISLALTVTISILLCAALFIVTLGDEFVRWFTLRFHSTSPLWIAWKDLEWPAAALFVALAFTLIDHFGPDVKDRNWRLLTPGTVFGVVLWLAACLGFRAYLHFYNAYTTTYGSLAAFMVLLVWLYATAFAFLIGGAINAEIGRAITGLPASPSLSSLPE